MRELVERRVRLNGGLQLHKSRGLLPKLGRPKLQTVIGRRAEMAIYSHSPRCMEGARES